MPSSTSIPTALPTIPLVMRVTSLADFCREVPASAEVRLLFVVTAGQHMARHMVSLQALNATGAIVWLAELHNVDWLYGQPFGPIAASIAAGTRELFRLVQTWLVEHGYTLQIGDYALPDFLHPLAANFECAAWVRDNKTETWQVVAASPTTLA